MQSGLKPNLKQFSILVLVNAFVGGMVGLERSIFPELAETEFGLSSTSAILSFIAAFGLAKAAANYFMGRWANRVGRKNLLVIGWVIALFVPLLIIEATSWTVIVFANVLLGFSQGLTWSSTVIMKIDLVGEKDRGFAMGINEFAGYLAVGLFAFISSALASEYGLRPIPFYLGIILALLGLSISIFAVKDTKHHVLNESQKHNGTKTEQVFWSTTWRNKTLMSITQAGFVNNLNDGMIWGLLPIFLAQLAFDQNQIGLIAGIYPMVWGIAQLFTGKMGDHLKKSQILFYGMLLQGVVILILPSTTSYVPLIIMATLLGLGTALVYPNFLSSIADATHPEQRAESIGVFRMWRDLGYVFGALISGIIADIFSIEAAIASIGIITVLSSLVIKRYNRV